MKPFILRRALLSILFILSSISIETAYSKTFTFTAIPDQDQTRLKQRFEKVATYLEKELEVEVKYIPVKSYSAAVAAFRNNQVQLAWFGGLSGVQARKLVPGSQAIAQGEEDQYFKSVIIANTKTKLTPSDKLPATPEQYTFAFGSKGSTSGRLMPEFYLREHYNKPSNETFKKIGFSGDHSRTIAVVQTGAYDLGALNYKVWEQALTDGRVNLDQVSVIWTTPNYPDYQWTIRGDVPSVWGDHFIKKVQNALISMDDPELLSAFPRTKFIPAQASDYQVILDTAKSIGLVD